MLHVPKINNVVDVTLNIGLSSSLNWGGYKNHGRTNVVPNLVDILNTPYKYAMVLEKVRELSLDRDQVAYSVAQSGTEATLIVKFRALSSNIVGQVWGLSESLRQDCIALWIHNDVNGGCGQLIGRYNYIWGHFNADYFMHLN